MALKYTLSRFEVVGWFNWAQLDSTELSSTQLSSARLNGAQLDSTDSAELSSTQRSSARLSWAQLDSTELSSTQLSSARLSWAQLDSTELSSQASSVQPRNSTEASIRGYDLRCVPTCVRVDLQGPYIIISCLPIQNIVYPISTNPPPFFLMFLFWVSYKSTSELR